MLKCDMCVNNKTKLCSECMVKGYPINYEPVTEDLVSHPAHYCYSKYEPKDVIRAWGLNFNLGSAVKYVVRAGRKDDILQDLNKAKQFLEFEIQAIEEERNSDRNK